MEINCETIEHLAELSNFSVSKEQSAALEKDLKGILEYISQLETIDVADVEPTYQVIEMENVWRDDEILPQDATREELLALSKEQKDNQLKVPKVL